jgi:hypothetical protein
MKMHSMKKSTTLLFTFILITSYAFAGNGKHQPVEIISTKRDIFYFKVSHEFLGATVEVVAADGRIMLSDAIQHSKSLIDFYFEQPGQYTIRVAKGDKVEIFTYEKTSDSPFVELDSAATLTLN